MTNDQNMGFDATNPSDPKNAMFFFTLASLAYKSQPEMGSAAATSMQTVDRNSICTPRTALPPKNADCATGGSEFVDRRLKIQVPG
jgi:hypothetical protein